jgi:hypothetical protein
VPVDLDNSGLITKAAMVAGSIGMQISSSGTELHSGNGETGVDTVQPMSGWWMYETSKYLIHNTQYASKFVKLAD